MSREMDALVAEKVMGLSVRKRNARQRGGGDWVIAAPHACDVYMQTAREPDRYSTDPAADYEVLKHVREKWDCPINFAEQLNRIWLNRDGQLDDDTLCVLYQPGDYARAALAALGVKEPA